MCEGNRGSMEARPPEHDDYEHTQKGGSRRGSTAGNTATSDSSKGGTVDVYGHGNVSPANDREYKEEIYSFDAFLGYSELGNTSIASKAESVRIKGTVLDVPPVR
ncbi:hypothetical protein BDQ17DRAFT_1332751 [Cyathus striatus]|nr:hypothetical protein BDQ17DRAFT_1332751 [Cyathus striatus]